MRYLFYLGFFLVSLRTAAQGDSVLLKPVDVIGFSEEKYLTGSAFTTIDSSLTRQLLSSHIGEMLSFQLPVYFRNYGNSGISGISLRGTAPQHTAVLWNGVNINSFSHGQADFSILPVSAADQIKVHEGGGSSRFGSGAFGGTVLLNSGSRENSNISFTQEAGSFDRWASVLRASFSESRWSARVRGYRQSSENNFPVKETGSRQPHAAFLQQGVLSDVSYSIDSRNEIELHYWYHESDREIQPTIGQNISTDNQQDYNHRFSANYKLHLTRSFVSATAAYVNDVIVYNGDRSEIGRWVGKFSHQAVLFKKIKTEIFGEGSAIEAKLRNYANGIARENRYDVGASFLYAPAERFKASFNIRKPFVTGFHAPILPYLGVKYKLLKSDAGRTVSLKANASRNYRIPTFNDRYWLDAGSTALLPELSLASEAGLEFSAGKFLLSGDLFYQRVEQWILWEPVDDDWIPKNVNEVTVKGIQLKSKVNTQISSVKLDAFATWQYAQSIVTKTSPQRMHTLNKQLIYTPYHTASFVLNIGVKNFLFAPSAQYSSKRFTDTSNDDLYALPAFVLVNTNLGYATIINQHRFDVMFSIKNLTNKRYQLYQARAMPGRNYSIQINYQLNLKQRKK